LLLFLVEIKMVTHAGRFVEHGEYNGHLYGTTFDQVTSIVNAGLVCVICSNTKVRACEIFRWLNVNTGEYFYQITDEIYEKIYVGYNVKS